MKIVFTGPESSGKSTLANWSSKIYGLPLVPEVARYYLSALNTPYQAPHVREIGLLQHFEEKLYNAKHQNIICDTDLLTIVIWLEVKFGIYDDHLTETWKQSQVDLYFLCHPDIPWEADPMRENPHDRDELLERHLQYLNQYQKHYVLLTGGLEKRQEVIKNTISKHLPNLGMYA